MRKTDDPIIREQMLQMYRLGHSHQEVAHAIDLGVSTLRKHLREDDEFEAQVQAAMATAFNPVLNHAIELSKQADAMGENDGALKALDMVMKYYTKHLDREHASALLEQKLDHETRQLEGQGRLPMLTTPEAVVAFVAELEKGPVIDAESWEVESE